jgi:hypothetical protein
MSTSYTDIANGHITNGISVHREVSSCLGIRENLSCMFMLQTKSEFGPYASGSDQIRILIWSDHTRIVINELDQIGI